MAPLLEIPRAPEVLVLEVDRLWDGGAPPRSELRGTVRLSVDGYGLRVEAGMPHQDPPRIPAAPPGARVEKLWEHDVMECFLVGSDGRYVELELGAGGHWLLLAFSAPRARSNALADARLEVSWSEDGQGWTSRCTLPRRQLPLPLVAANAFAIGGGHHLAHRPTGGGHPDFHRTDRYPAVRIPSWE